MKRLPTLLLILAFSFGVYAYKSGILFPIASAQTQTEVRYIKNLDKWLHVTRVIDGDTIEVSDRLGKRYRIRLLGIDAPETKYSYRPATCYGDRAKSYARIKLQKQYVFLEQDKSQNQKDAYGRLLAYVYTKGMKLFNEEIIRDGYAQEYTYKKPYQKRDAF